MPEFTVEDLRVHGLRGLIRSAAETAEVDPAVLTELADADLSPFVARAQSYTSNFACGAPTCQATTVAALRTAAAAAAVLVSALETAADVVEGSRGGLKTVVSKRGLPTSCRVFE